MKLLHETKRRLPLAALLTLASACQVSTFAHHAEQVAAGESVRVDLQAVFGTSSGGSLDGQLFACVALPEGWSAPSGAWVLPDVTTTDPADGGLPPLEFAPAAPEPLVAAEAQARFPHEGSDWHCLTTDRLQTVQSELLVALAQLSLQPPAGTTGRFVLPYLTGSRLAVVAPEPEEGAEVSYHPAEFSGLLRRTLNVGVGPASTFDHWELGGIDAAPPGIKIAPVLEEAPAAIWGNGRFLLAGDGSLFASEDGRLWTALEVEIDGDALSTAPRALLHAQDRFFGVLGASILVSGDGGQGWTTVHAAAEDDVRELNAMANAGDRLIAVGTDGLILTSVDGVTWVDESLVEGPSLSFVSVGAGSILAAGDALVRRKADGTGWELIASEPLTGRAFRSLVYGNGQFMVSASLVEPILGEDAPLFVSADGTDWTQLPGFKVQATEESFQAAIVSYVDRTFLVSVLDAASLMGSSMLLPSELFSSVDGTQWTTHATGYAGFTVGFAEGGGRVLSLGLFTVLVAEQRPWPGPVFGEDALPWAVVGQGYSAQVQTSGGIDPVRLAVSAGELPPGLAFQEGAFSGTPTVAGTSALTLSATDRRGTIGTRDYALRVAGVLSVGGGPVLTPGTKAASYEAVLVAEGGAAPYTWSQPSGTLPAGLTLASDARGYVLSGTPSAAGESTFTVAVSDASGQSAQKELTLTVAEAQPEPKPEPEAQGCGCTQSGGLMGLELLAFAGLALLHRRRARRA